MAKFQITQANVPEGVIDLGVGQPQVDLLPLEKLQTAATHQFHQHNCDVLQYGMQQGGPNFREMLAGFLSREYGIGVDRDALLVTSGISQALDFICTLLTRPGDTIIVEEPSYFLALRIFTDHHLNIVGTPMDENGLVIPALEENIRKYKPKLVYTVPVFHNPSGVTLSGKRRGQLAGLSKKYNVIVVADEVYQLLGYTRTPPPPMATIDSSANVISLGSFSKILAPGLRLGWMQADKKLLEPFIECGFLDSGGGLNPFVSSVVSSMIELGLQKENLNHLKKVYAARMHRLAEALREKIPVLDFSEPMGGFFVWARFKNGVDAETILEKAVEHQTGFQPGVRFTSMNGLHDYLRICFTYYGTDDLLEGVDRLARAVEDST